MNKMYEISSKIESHVLENGESYFETILELFKEYSDCDCEMTVEQFARCLSPKIKFELEKELRELHLMKDNSKIKELL